MHETFETQLQQLIVAGLEAASPGEKVEFTFPNINRAFEVRFRCVSGGEAHYTVIPGQSLKFIRGEGDDFDHITIHLLEPAGIQ